METKEIFIKGPCQQLIGRGMFTGTESRTFYDNRVKGKLVTHPEMTEEALSQFQALKNLPEHTFSVISLEVEIVGDKITRVIGFQEKSRLPV